MFSLKLSFPEFYTSMKSVFNSERKCITGTVSASTLLSTYKICACYNIKV